MEDTAKLYETHNGRELKIDVGPRGLWYVSSTGGGLPCAPCNSAYTSFNLAEKAVKDYLRDTYKAPPKRIVTHAMEKRELLLKEQALAESQNN